jgi:hypothetical protein
LDHAADGADANRRERGCAVVVNPGEQRPAPPWPHVEPSPDCCNGIGRDLHSPDDADHLPVAFLVGLGPTNSDQQAVGSRSDVGELERCELAGAYRGCVAEQDDRAVPQPVGRTGVNGVDDPGELGDVEWVCLSAWRDADDAAESATDPS